MDKAKRKVNAHTKILDIYICWQPKKNIFLASTIVKFTNTKQKYRKLEISNYTTVN